MTEALIGTVVGFLLGLVAWGVKGTLTSLADQSVGFNLIMNEARDHLAVVKEMWQKVTTEEKETGPNIVYFHCQSFANYPLPPFSDYAFRAFASRLLTRAYTQQLPSLCEFYRLLASLTQLHHHLRDLWKEQQDNWRVAAGGKDATTYRVGEGKPQMSFQDHSTYNWARLERHTQQITELGEKILKGRNNQIQQSPQSATQTDLGIGQMNEDEP